MKKLYSILLMLIVSLILFVPDINGNAQSVSYPLFSKSSPRFISDLCYYKGSADQAQIELAYSVKLIELTFKSTNDQLTASINCSLIIKDSDNKIVIQKSRQKTVTARTQGEIKDESRGIIDMFVFDLPAGGYELEISLEDKFSKSVSRSNNTLQVPAFGKSLSMSTPLLALAVTSDLTQKLFVKGNRVILPNVSHDFIYHKSILQFYFEAYNLITPSDSASSFLQASYLVTDYHGDSLLYIPNQMIKKPGTSCAKIQALDIRGLDIGEYTLVVQLDEPGSTRRVNQKVKFQIVKSAVKKQVLPMSEAVIQKYRDQIMYFTTHDELKLFDKLGLQGKANFLIQFWRSRDETPDTPENEFMKDCFQRIDYANKNFKGDGNGLNSDMGRVFCIYGPPDDIEKHIMNLETKPFIIWRYYSVYGGKHDFVFVDGNDDSIFDLVHSTVDTEIQNEYWMDQELK